MTNNMNAMELSDEQLASVTGGDGSPQINAIVQVAVAKSTDAGGNIILGSDNYIGNASALNYNVSLQKNKKF